MSDDAVLYGATGSGSAAVEIALQWAGLPYRVVEVATWLPASDLDALRRLNPLGQIPTLQWPNGTVWTESAAMLLQLGLAHPASGLLPPAPADRDRTVRGLVYIAANCYSAVGIADYPERWLPGADAAACAALKAGAVARLHGAWRDFFDSTDAAPFLGGAAPSALDVLAAVVSAWSGTRAHLRTARPAAAELLARLDGHPRLAPVLVRHQLAGR